MKIEVIALLLAIADTCCWVVCFWWMHRISARQDATLNELHAVTRRIEKLSEQEHALISEVHPVVEKIHESVENVKDAVAEEQPSRK
ncbi:MAG: hypothetical protein ACJ8JD_05585 [Chthoniobacterales bacterium]